MKSNLPTEDRPGKTAGFRIVEIHAFVTVDDDIEGVVAYLGPAGWSPLICADQARVDSMRSMAQDIATATNKTIKLAKFSVREDVEEIKPKP